MAGSLAQPSARLSFFNIKKLKAKSIAPEVGQISRLVVSLPQKRSTAGLRLALVQQGLQPRTVVVGRKTVYLRISLSLKEVVKRHCRQGSQQPL